MAVHHRLLRTHQAQQTVQMLFQFGIDRQVDVELGDIAGAAVSSSNRGRAGFRLAGLVYQLEHALVQVHDAVISAGRLRTAAVKRLHFGAAHHKFKRVLHLAHGSALQIQHLMRAHHRPLRGFKHTGRCRCRNRFIAHRHGVKRIAGALNLVHDAARHQLAQNARIALDIARQRIPVDQR